MDHPVGELIAQLLGAGGIDLIGGIVLGGIAPADQGRCGEFAGLRVFVLVVERKFQFVLTEIDEVVGVRCQHLHYGGAVDICHGIGFQ